jgi:translation initiation factor IF-1
VVFGVNVIRRDTLKEGSQVEAKVEALIDDGVKMIAQIRGSYLKVKVKQCKAGEISVGDNIAVNLLKVTKQKITGIFLGKIAAADPDDS